MRRSTRKFCGQEWPWHRESAMYGSKPAHKKAGQNGVATTLPSIVPSLPLIYLAHAVTPIVAVSVFRLNEFNPESVSTRSPAWPTV